MWFSNSKIVVVVGDDELSDKKYLWVQWNTITKNIGWIDYRNIEYGRNQYEETKSARTCGRVFLLCGKWTTNENIRGKCMSSSELLVKAIAASHIPSTGNWYGQSWGPRNISIACQTLWIETTWNLRYYLGRKLKKNNYGDRSYLNWVQFVNSPDKCFEKIIRNICRPTDRRHAACRRVCSGASRRNTSK